MEPAEKELQEVTLDEAMSIAVLFQQHGKLDEAEDVYRRVLEQWPDHADALHFSGILAHQRGRSDEGLALIDRSLAIDPEQADCYNNRGIILKARGRFDEAAASYRRAIALNGQHANAHSNLGVLLRAEGRFEEAEAEYLAAIAINPNHIDAYHNLGTLLAGRGRTKEAVTCFCKVTTLSPAHPDARRLLAAAHCTLGEIDKAVKIYRDWIAEEPDNPVARHMLAAVSGEQVPARASDTYVERIFDGFAESFDQKLAQLSYQAPAIVNALVEDAGLIADKSLEILDAGCGTGLCGPWLAPYARRLAGVDLSGGMLVRAHERGVYNDLYKGELMAFLRESGQTFDLIVSADTLVYFGGLEDVIEVTRRALRENGWLVFTLEALEPGRSARGFELMTHGRYAHDRSYVERLLEAAGMQTVIAQVELRMEAGAPVAGLGVRAQKAGGQRA